MQLSTTLQFSCPHEHVASLQKKKKKRFDIIALRIPLYFRHVLFSIVLLLSLSVRSISFFPFCWLKFIIHYLREKLISICNWGKLVYYLRSQPKNSQTSAHISILCWSVETKTKRKLHKVLTTGYKAMSKL